MPRVKRPTKKSRGGSSSMEPPPQDHPLTQWFYNKEDFDLYLSDFAPRKVVPPRYLEPNFFDQHHYPNLLGILVRQNLVNCLKIKDSYYPDLIAIAYTTLDVEFEEDDVVFSFKIGKNTYALESSELSAIWSLNYNGEKVESGHTSEYFRRNYSKENACTMFNIPIGIPKPTVGLLNVEHRLLHYFLTYVLVPRSGNHGLILDEDLEIMWRMVNGQQINWVHLIVTHMRRTKPGNSKGLPYAILWTAIFKYVGIDLSQADKKRLGYNHCIDTHVLNHMKRNIHEDPQQEEEAQPQEPQDQQSEQPLMNDMMQVLLRREQNQANMGNRLERIEKNQARMLRKIRRVKAYTFSEDEAEDDDDDLD
ncbi:hypothetical protein PIB30_101569 [Stylosanthes scabra]|uniref:Uncharacterized protein n=2 Tax=Stylosanthes scabra TaxID=79078 RepID=A0ABU6SZU6_9FABA|nr:hypothetical protein [Stylosanthes scabra]